MLFDRSSGRAPTYACTHARVCVELARTKTLFSSSLLGTQLKPPYEDCSSGGSQESLKSISLGLISRYRDERSMRNKNCMTPSMVKQSNPHPYRERTQGVQILRVMVSMTGRIRLRFSSWRCRTFRSRIQVSQVRPFDTHPSSQWPLHASHVRTHSLGQKMHERHGTDQPTYTHVLVEQVRRGNLRCLGGGRGGGGRGCGTA
jgi:hypothetical protein